MYQDLNTSITKAVLLGLEETFENVNGIYLDKGTSIFETLATISADEASQASAGNCATIAAHVAHMTYYIDILVQFINGETPETDWDAIWNTVQTVTTDEWNESQKQLKDAYREIRQIASDMEWEDDRQIAGALGVIAHNAYHLGEIRQMLCRIKPDTSDS